MRKDLTQSLEKNHIEPSSLSRFQRVLLTTDGTVTEMIEAYLFEQIQLLKMSENLISTDRDIWQLQLSKGEKVIERKIFLKGKISSRNYIYAESILALERLEENFRKELLETQTPIGKVWRQQRIETFK
ncbi:MAG: chorismate pyruvate-lyase family protein [Trichodesmium sp. MO_231.B1]|nr:chorismate pyruvate-lyase family protein [Trichodesmium sp. MO_231.B1]